MTNLIEDFLEKKDMRIQYIKNTEETVLLINSENDMREFEEFLEKNGSSWEEFKEENKLSDYHFYEEYIICNECGSYLYLSNFNYGFVYDNQNQQYVCNECADWSSVIEGYQNNSNSCINTDYDDLHYILNNENWIVYDVYDFEPYNDNYIEPKDIINKKINTNKYNFLWVLESTIPFSTRATLYIQSKEK